MAYQVVANLCLFLKTKGCVLLKVAQSAPCVWVKLHGEVSAKGTGPWGQVQNAIGCLLPTGLSTWIMGFDWPLDPLINFTFQVLLGPPVN